MFLSFGVSIVAFDYIKANFAADWSTYKLLTIASVMSLSFVFLLTTSLFARKIWALFRFFNKNLYPDLNGEWSGTIETSEGEKLEVRAIVKQGLLRTELDMHGRTFKSLTLECTPTMEFGQKKLYYVYRTTPKKPSWAPYDGATLLDVVDSDDGLRLSGKYYTERLKNGRISLSKLSENTRKDIAYY